MALARKVQLLCMGGTSESYSGDVRREVTGMLKTVTDFVDRDIFDVRWVGYPADYGMKMSYFESVQLGRRELARAIHHYTDGTPNSAVALTYSQSCTFANSLLAIGEFEPEVFAGTANLGNPWRRKGSYIGPIAPAAGSYGIAGEVFLPSDKVFSLDVVAPGDTITEARDDSLLRSVADFTEYMSTDLLAWATECIDLVRDEGWQLAKQEQRGILYALQQVNQAIVDARRYLPYDQYLNPTGGRHTAYGVEKVPGFDYTWSEMLAHALNVKGRSLL